MTIDPKELDEAIGAFGRVVTETQIPQALRREAENKVRAFLLALRDRAGLQITEKGK